MMGRTKALDCILDHLDVGRFTNLNPERGSLDDRIFVSARQSFKFVAIEAPPKLIRIHRTKERHSPAVRNLAEPVEGKYSVSNLTKSGVLSSSI